MGGWERKTDGVAEMKIDKSSRKGELATSTHRTAGPLASEEVETDVFRNRLGLDFGLMNCHSVYPI